jgi:hypothetical protein
VRPLYAAKLEDLGPADRIKVECGGCKRVGLIAAAGLGLPPHTAVLDLCTGCVARVAALVAGLASLSFGRTRHRGCRP